LGVLPNGEFPNLDLPSAFNALQQGSHLHSSLPCAYDHLTARFLKPKLPSNTNHLQLEQSQDNTQHEKEPTVNNFNQSISIGNTNYERTQGNAISDETQEAVDVANAESLGGEHRNGTPSSVNSLFLIYKELSYRET
jgi:hypothetical protein